MAPVPQEPALLPHVGSAHRLCIPDAYIGLYNLQLCTPHRVHLPTGRATLVCGDTNCIGIHHSYLCGIYQGFASPPALGNT